MNDKFLNGPDTRSNDTIADKTKTAQQAISTIQSGDSVFIGTACATPRTLIQALEAREDNLFNVRLIHFLTDGAIPIENGLPKTGFQHKVFFVRQQVFSHATVALPAVGGPMFAGTGDHVAPPAVIADATAGDVVDDDPVPSSEALQPRTLGHDLSARLMASNHPLVFLRSLAKVLVIDGTDVAATESG